MQKPHTESDLACSKSPAWRYVTARKKVEISRYGTVCSHCPWLQRTQCIDSDGSGWLCRWDGGQMGKVGRESNGNAIFVPGYWCEVPRRSDSGQATLPPITSPPMSILPTGHPYIHPYSAWAPLPWSQPITLLQTTTEVSLEPCLQVKGLGSFVGQHAGIQAHVIQPWASQKASFKGRL